MLPIFPKDSSKLSLKTSDFLPLESKSTTVSVSVSIPESMAETGSKSPSRLALHLLPESLPKSNDPLDSQPTTSSCSQKISRSVAKSPAKTGTTRTPKSGPKVRLKSDPKWSQKIPSQRQIKAELARRGFPYFAQLAHPRLKLTPFHKTYYEVLEQFARGKIRRLIVTIPPQHGKSLGASVLLPAYMLGLNPDLRICIASYAVSLASKFNRQIQRTMSSLLYAAAFPESRLKQSAADRNYIRTNEEFELVGRFGSLLAVGREGALTGNQVDIMILDDLYKDALEANSPLIRENAWDWYTSVVRTRLHNDSQELIVFTRWHEDDLIGRLSDKEPVLTLTDLKQLNKLPDNTWVKLNFEALKTGRPEPIDPRIPGEALWEERQNVALLTEKQRLDSQQFECMYQGNPSSRAGLLYGDRFKTYDDLPAETLKKANYTDTADMGEDYLCSVCYEIGRDGVIYITDLLYTQAAMEFTEEAVAALLQRNLTRVAYVESNNGGRGFARSVARKCSLAKVEWFNQTANKEARILTNAATVLQKICMPADWKLRWPQLARDLIAYRRNFKANRWHDAPDVFTGIVEREMVTPETKAKIKGFGFSA